MNKLKFAILAVLISILIPTHLNSQKATHSEPQQATESIIGTSISEKQEKPTLYPELKPVCACESLGRSDVEPTHYDKNGDVLIGKINPRDVGICQINLDAHEETMKSMNLDPYIKSDNIEYANFLYDTQGLTPWQFSRHCWG